jgi:ribonuclease HI
VDDAGAVVAEIAEGIGVATNNVAEYTAVIRGLERARDLGAREVLVRSDSRLLVEQLSGRFKV